MTSNKAKGQYMARLENQKAQLERHGNFAEVIIRTTPEATDMINFARLWEHILVVADRQTRGYIAKTSRGDFDKTRDDFNESVDFMSKKIKEALKRHDIDLSGSNFVSRIAQRYEIAERKKKAEKPKENNREGNLTEAISNADGNVAEKIPKDAAATAQAQPAPKTAPQAAPVASKNDEVDGF